MTQAEKRKFIRLDSLHLLNYVLINEEGDESDSSMGRTLDVSINGIKIETVKEIPQDSSLIITLGIEENLVDISGRTTHIRKQDGRYTSGIEFLKVTTENRTILRQYVDEFQARKETLLKQDDFPS